MNCEIRWEMFYASNTPIFANPNSTRPAAGVETIGQIISAIGGPRTMHAGLRLTFSS